MKRRKGLFLLPLLMCFLAACGSQKHETVENTSSSIQNTASSDKENSRKSKEEASDNDILIVYFSRYGNTEYPNDVDASTSASITTEGNKRYGTTEYTANLIQQTVGGDIHLIETAAPYTADFDELRDVNHEEMQENILPELKESDLDISKYDVVFIGYPVWAAEVPQAVLSFLNEYNLSGKMVIPFCTHDGYGAGNSYETIRKASHVSELPDGLAIEAEDVPDAEDTVKTWLEDIGFVEKDAEAENQETPITITVGDTVLDGVLYDTALAREIKEQFPLTISMSSYGEREYYGGVEFYPAEENLTGGKRTFENGDITYCEEHHNMAVFYAQTEQAELSVDVIPIGKVTSDLSVFEDFDSSERITFSLKK